MEIWKADGRMVGSSACYAPSPSPSAVAIMAEVTSNSEEEDDSPPTLLLLLLLPCLLEVMPKLAETATTIRTEM